MTKTSHPVSRTLLAAVAAAALWAPASTAEWLVLKDGSRLEIDGDWKEQGRNAVFQLPSGTLSMLPLDEIDAAATTVANQPEKAAEPTPVPEPKRSGVVLNNDNVRAAPPAGRAATDAGGEAATDGGDPASEATGGETPSAATLPTLEVVNWAEQGDSVDGLEIFGTVRNPSNRPVAGIRMTIYLIDSNGGRGATTVGRLTTNALGAAQTTNFRALFQDEFAYERLEFEFSSNGFTLGSGGDRPGTNNEDDG